MAPAIELRGVTKRFLTPSGAIHTALRDLDMTVEPGEFCAVVGPTGCGKSTTLALISGLEPASEGEVDVFGKPVDGIEDGIGYVFQADAVFPWKTVLENVAAGPRYKGASNRDARDRARDWISRVGLSGFEDRYPYQLSGGMRKRVAVRRALVPGSGGDVLQHGLPWKDRIGLEHVADAVLDSVNGLAEHIDLAFAGGLEARDQGERGRLATTCRPDYGTELARLDRHVEIPQRRVDRTRRREEAFRNAAELDGGGHSC